MSIYPKTPFEIGSGSGVTLSNRTADKRVAVRPPLPGTVILIHGVNDVGTAYGEVERGLCAGLGTRLGQPHLYVPAGYRLWTEKDKDKLEDDPDAVFFKRLANDGTYSPVIPFYWGYREEEGRYAPSTHTPHGQATDRFGNRLDKDFSKGGGPFANATSSLADMWNRGFGSGPFNPADKASKDPLRPVLKAPGRLYMILAAQRLMALISMIRDYDPNETVSLVAHSQGCMLSLLAQAFLMQRGLRPADTLVLTHPPYSLVDDLPWLNDAVNLFSGGEDAAMSGRYRAINDLQTMDARLRTLANIVKGVAQRKQATPSLHTLRDPAYQGVVGSAWEPGSPERDNRGKVYLYFCPEDMTVALDNVQGIGWQGVPDFVTGSQLKPVTKKDSWGRQHEEWRPEVVRREARKELGAGFFQRVFTARRRQPVGGKDGARPVLVGAEAPYNFALRLEGEDDFAHAAEEAKSLRTHSPEVEWPVVKTLWGGLLTKSEANQRKGIRAITGEKLKAPWVADMNAGGLVRPGQAGVDPMHEAVDPIDAAISVTSDYGLQDIWQLQDDPAGGSTASVGTTFQASPWPALHANEVIVAPELVARIDAVVNAAAKEARRRRRIVAVYRCLKRPSPQQGPSPIGKLLVLMKESADEARLRQQQRGVAARSFHGAIFGSAANHEHVTAYDVAIGQGYAPSRPEFNAYLCAVADWRLKRRDLKESIRPGIRTWTSFLKEFGAFYDVEPAWRKQLIDGNCTYYSTGALPTLPLLPEGLPPTVVCETMNGRRTGPPPQEATAKAVRASP